MNRMYWLICFGTASLLGAGAHGYEGAKVTSGGTIVVKAILSGPFLEPKHFEIIKDREFCGDHIAPEALSLGDSGGIPNVVATIKNIQVGKPIDPNAQVELDNRNCQFVPHVQTAVVGSRLLIRNSDPILHNTHAFINGKRTAFNLALPIQGMEIIKKLKRPGLLSMTCDAGHTWMSAYVVVTEHPYASVTDNHGFCTLDDVPPGKYTIGAWHETLGEQTMEIEVSAGDTVAVTFEFRASEAEHSMGQSQVK